MTSQIHESGAVPAAVGFRNDCVEVSIDRLHPLKRQSPELRATSKYRQILASISKVGVVEPPAVVPDESRPGEYFVLDGHVRLEALRELGARSVECLVARQDDTYTYNRHVCRLTTIQEHRMIAKAANANVPLELIAGALGLSEATIRQNFRMLAGICPEVVQRLADKPCPAHIFPLLRQMKPIRQMEAADLMVAQGNYSKAFVGAMLAATAPDQLVTVPRSTSASFETIAKLEQELAALQRQNKQVEDTYGTDVLKLTVIKGYFQALLTRAKVVRWLASNRPEYLKEFQAIADLSRLPEG